MKSFHFSLGDSTNGPIGFCAMVRAEDEERALAQLAAALERIDEEATVIRDDGDIEYLAVYFNAGALSVGDIDYWDKEGEEEGE